MLTKLFETTNQPFSPEAFAAFRQTLVMAGEGMVGIFIVMGLFWGIIVLMSKLKDN